jgi:hypothetical protein
LILDLCQNNWTQDSTDVLGEGEAAVAKTRSILDLAQGVKSSKAINIIIVLPCIIVKCWLRLGCPKKLVLIPNNRNWKRN